MRPSINESEQESGENVIMQNMFSAECRGFSLFFFFFFPQKMLWANVCLVVRCGVRLRCGRLFCFRHLTSVLFAADVEW